MSNPLFAPQREKAGSQTLAKYSYQYHWALERALLEHQKNVEYAIFVELHEDVVHATSLEQTKARFEFNQIKTDAAPFSKTKLTKLKNGRSVLGKLLEGTSQKPYSGSITEINLVAVNGFSLRLKTPNVTPHKFSVSEIENIDLNDLKGKLQKEIEGCALPTTLNFVIPSLKQENHQRVLIGEISEIIKALFPNSTYDSTHIYQLLIDDLFRKGQDVFDYKNWEDALERKALTSQKVTKTINEYTSHKNDAAIEVEYQEIVRELGYNSIKKRGINRAFTRYKNQAYGSRSPYQLKLSQTIRDSIGKNLPLCNTEIGKLIDLVCSEMSTKNKMTINQKNELLGGIIYEFITSQET